MLKKISDLKNKILKTEELVDDLLLSLEAQQNKINNKEKIILKLKEEVKINLKKIDEILDEYNAKSKPIFQGLKQKLILIKMNKIDYINLLKILKLD